MMSRYKAAFFIWGDFMIKKLFYNFFQIESQIMRTKKNIDEIVKYARPWRPPVKLKR